MLAFDGISYFDIYIQRDRQTGRLREMNGSGTFSVVTFRWIISAAWNGL